MNQLDTPIPKSPWVLTRSAGSTRWETKIPELCVLVLSPPGAAVWPWTSHSPALGLQLPRPTTPGTFKDSSHSWQVVWQSHFPLLRPPEQPGGWSGTSHLSEPSFHHQLLFSKDSYNFGVIQHSLLLLMPSTPDFLQGKPPPPPQPWAVDGVETTRGQEWLSQAQTCIPSPEPPLNCPEGSHVAPFQSPAVGLWTYSKCWEEWEHQIWEGWLLELLAAVLPLLEREPLQRQSQVCVC